MAAQPTTPTIYLTVQPPTPSTDAAPTHEELEQPDVVAAVPTLRSTMTQQELAAYVLNFATQAGVKLGTKASGLGGAARREEA
tara:strand:- start:152 stop:400 length:249 start_codon:yes stop_codon:yes gene_type:complete